MAVEKEFKVKIKIQETANLQETEVIINCRQTDENILKMLAMLRVLDKKITGMKAGETFLLDAAEILYIDTVDKKTFFYTEKEVYETPLRLYELEERLQSCDFVRTSKAGLVNFNQIKSLRPDMGSRMRLTMNNGETIIVSRQYVPDIKRKLGI
ncbi:MAG: LytTR family transcriptional regulator DNA-binding domain-containing protein [Lachnospiraceae bacterium]|nr:LytTR family transcriptional regulator DNA-binding domain-containing protein [Lachnospiraceae bacterium]